MAFRFGSGPILDVFPNAQAAYGLRRLSSSYTGSCITVRRSSDNTTKNIGFSRFLLLDINDLLSFVGSGDGFVTGWFDQSGNNVNLSQGTAASQFNIVSSGRLILEGNDIVMSGSTNRGFTRGTNTVSLSDWTVYIKARNRSDVSYIGGNFGLLTSLATDSFNFRQSSDNSYKFLIFPNGYTTNYRKIQGTRVSSTGGLQGFANGVPATTSTTNESLTLSTGTVIFGNFAGSGYQGSVREMIIYPVTHDNFTIQQINNMM